MVSPVVLAHISSLYDWVWKSGGGRRGVAHRALNRDSISLSVLLRTDRVGFPSASPQSRCLRFFDVRTLREAETCSTHHTAAADLWTNCSTSSAHEQFVHLVLQKEKQKNFLECLCMNLNFKLFLIFFFLIITSTELFWEKSYVNIWFISYPGYKRFMCGYSIKINVDWREISWDWGSSITSEFALWMYSVLDLVECSPACLNL